VLLISVLYLDIFDTVYQSVFIIIIIIIIIYIYIGCHRRNGPNFGRVFLMLNYTDITQNTYVQS